MKLYRKKINFTQIIHGSLLAFLLFACDDSSQIPAQILDQNSPIALDQRIQIDQSLPIDSQGLESPDMEQTWDSVWPTMNMGLSTDNLHQKCFALEVSSPQTYQPWILGITQEGSYQWYRLEDESNRNLEIARFHMQASDLDTYLLYDHTQHYLILSDEGLTSQKTLSVQGGLELNREIVTAHSFGEWELQAHESRSTGWQLWNRGTNQLLTTKIWHDETTPPDTTPQTLVLQLIEQTDCIQPEYLSIDAHGAIEKTHFDNGDLFGIVDAHSHIFSHIGFGPGLHGDAYHPLGVTHALNDCSVVHGEEGRKDLWGYFSQGFDGLNTQNLIAGLADKATPEFNHHTDGYPTFTDWPNAPFSDTHQTQYYMWLKRAWLSGLRLVVMHAVSNQVICELQTYVQDDHNQYDCNEMDRIEESIKATYGMQRYIDAQMGGRGKGFLEVVTTPAQARAVIAQGKLALIIGIETSNLFNCYSTTRTGRPMCDETYLQSQFDKFYELGVRVLFPVHKFDNAFSAGDGHRGVIELANFINSGQWSSFTQECDLNAPRNFDHGDVIFGGLNQVRMQYAGDPVADLMNFAMNPLATLLPYIDQITAGKLEGNWCQSHGLTDLGQSLLKKLVSKGMLIELDHFPKRSYEVAFNLLTEWQYPGALGTHGETFQGRLYQLGGLSKIKLGRCHDSEQPRAVLNQLDRHLSQLADAGRYLAEGFAFDLNGFAGYPKPRFGPLSDCIQEQNNPVTYPFQSWAGDIEFTQPHLAERVVDFNQEGLTHIGLLPELLQDALLSEIEHEDLSPIFKSAEAYLRVWEAAQARSEVLKAAGF